MSTPNPARTTTSTASAFGSRTGSGVVEWFLDDFRSYDTSGSVNNNWLGTCRVQGLLPNGDGATLDFTRSNTGLANWQNVANQNVDDSLYLSDNNPGDYNLSTVTPLVNAPVVYWVAVTSFIRQDDATAVTAKNVLYSDGTLAYGAPFNPPLTYAGDTDIWETDPHTGSQFTGAAVNALQIGPSVYAIA
jgi:hypothetical protein